MECAASQSCAWRELDGRPLRESTLGGRAKRSAPKADERWPGGGASRLPQRRPPEGVRTFRRTSADAAKRLKARAFERTRRLMLMAPGGPTFSQLLVGHRLWSLAQRRCSRAGALDLHHDQVSAPQALAGRARPSRGRAAGARLRDHRERRRPPGDGDWEATWSAELDRRADAAKARGGTAADWTDVRARILKRLLSPTRSGAPIGRTDGCSSLGSPTSCSSASRTTPSRRPASDGSTTSGRFVNSIASCVPRPATVWVFLHRTVSRSRVGAEPPRPRPPRLHRRRRSGRGRVRARPAAHSVGLRGLRLRRERVAEQRLAVTREVHRHRGPACSAG